MLNLYAEIYAGSFSLHAVDVHSLGEYYYFCGTRSYFSGKVVTMAPTFRTLHFRSSIWSSESDKLTMTLRQLEVELLASLRTRLTCGKKTRV